MRKAQKSKVRDVAAGAVLFVIALDLVVFVVASVGASFRLTVPTQELGFLAIVNGAAWALAIMDEGEGL
jgi:hypothetical protein